MNCSRITLIWKNRGEKAGRKHEMAGRQKAASILSICPLPLPAAARRLRTPLHPPVDHNPLVDLTRPNATS